MTLFTRVQLSDNRVAFARHEGGSLHLLRGAPWDALDHAETGEVVPREGARLLAPVNPSKVVCVGRNYRAHAAEMGNAVPVEPMLFLKPPSSVIGHGDSIVLPAQSHHVEHEAELGVVIGRRCRDVSEADALDYVFGYTCINDVSARDLQKKDGQWARAKGTDTFCPVGPVIAVGVDPGALSVRCRVDGATRQDGNTRDMVFSVARIISYISEVMTLEPGDLISTGTPHGTTKLEPGMTVEVDIEGIGVLSNPIREGRGRSAS